MPSIEERRKSRKAGFEPKWRHFHPSSRVWVKNPFPEVIKFYVADEANQQWEYEMPPNQLCELPGGAVATLGVKELVDRMIQEAGDMTHMWMLPYRAKYEDKIIKRIKEPPQKAAAAAGGTISLASEVSEDELFDDDDAVVVATQPGGDEEQPIQEASPKRQQPSAGGEAAFPGARRDKRGADKVKAIAAATVGGAKTDQIVEE